MHFNYQWISIWRNVFQEVRALKKNGKMLDCGCECNSTRAECMARQNRLSTPSVYIPISAHKTTALINFDYSKYAITKLWRQLMMNWTTAEADVNISYWKFNSIMNSRSVSLGLNFAMAIIEMIKVSGQTGPL